MKEMQTELEAARELTTAIAPSTPLGGTKRRITNAGAGWGANNVPSVHGTDADSTVIWLKGYPPDLLASTMRTHAVSVIQSCCPEFDNNVYKCSIRDFQMQV